MAEVQPRQVKRWTNTLEEVILALSATRHDREIAKLQSLHTELEAIDGRHTLPNEIAKPHT